MHVESWSRAAVDNAVNVNFTSGTNTCYGVHAVVQETEETVTVDLQGGTPPEAVGRACIMILVCPVASKVFTRDELAEAFANFGVGRRTSTTRCGSSRRP